VRSRRSQAAICSGASDLWEEDVSSGNVRFVGSMFCTTISSTDYQRGQLNCFASDNPDAVPWVDRLMITVAFTQRSDLTQAPNVGA
jgi:hypothetical protein